MADFRKVMGPFGREIVKFGDVRITWGFIGILADYETAHWTLIYRAEDRAFSVFRTQPTSIHIAGKGYHAAGPPVNRDMFIKGDNRIIASGTITNVLRTRLRPEDLALCAQLSMKGTSR